MAHVGKHYKLWFRRDAAWQLNNYAFAYPEAYWLFQHGTILSNRYDFGSLDLRYAINLKKTYDREWVSEPYGGFFDNTYWKVAIESEPDEIFTQFRFSIWHNAIIPFPVFSASYRTNESSPLYYNFQGGAMVQLHFLSPDVQVDPLRFAPWLFAARWDRYNPGG